MTSEEYFKIFKDNSLVIKNKILRLFANEYLVTCLAINKKSRFSVNLNVYYASEIKSLNFKKLKESVFILKKCDEKVFYTRINNEYLAFDGEYLSNLLKYLNMTMHLEGYYGKNHRFEITSRVDNFENIMNDILKPTIEPRYDEDLIKYMENIKYRYDIEYKDNMRSLEAYLKETTAYFADYIENGPEYFLNNLNYYTLKQINRPKEEKIALSAYKKKIVYIYAMNYNPVPLILDDLIKVLEERGIVVSKKNNKLIVNRGIKRKVLK